MDYEGENEALKGQKKQIRECAAMSSQRIESTRRRHANTGAIRASCIHWRSLETFHSQKTKKRVIGVSKRGNKGDLSVYVCLALFPKGLVALTRATVISSELFHRNYQ